MLSLLSGRLIITENGGRRRPTSPIMDLMPAALYYKLLVSNRTKETSQLICDVLYVKYAIIRYVSFLPE